MHDDLIRCIRCSTYKPATEYFLRLRSDPRLRSHCKVCNKKRATKIEPFDWIMAKINREAECWLWTGSLSKEGYGRIGLAQWSGTRQAHRVVYTLLIGPVPDNLDIDHVCHNADNECLGGRTCLHRRCVNPEHLIPASRAENVSRGRGRQRTIRRMHRTRGHMVAD